MIVYNTNPSEGLAKGLAMWNGVEWISLASSGGLSTVECKATTQNPVRINGNYTKNISVSAQTCYIVVPVYVDEPGLYTAEAIVYEGNSTTNKATFMFTGSGEFTAAGDNYITLSGYGSPTKSTADNANIENRIELSINEKLATSCPMPTIKVEDKQAVFSILCNSVQTFYSPQKKSIMQKQPINTTDNAVSIQVKVAGSPEAAAGNPALHLETDEINGVRFVLNTNATVPPNTQTFTLQGEGTPLKSGSYTYTITGNDASQTAICTANVTVGYDGDGLKVLMFSNADNGVWDLGEAANTPSRSAIPQMFNSKYLFDFGEYADAPFHIKDRNKITWLRKSPADINDGNYNSVDKFKDYHLVIVSYIAVPNSTVVEALCEYVKQGGTCLFTCDYNNDMYSSGSSYRRAEQIIDLLSYGHFTSTEKYYTTEISGDGDNSFTFLGGNLAVNGQYMDLTGKKLGRDGAGNFLFKNLPDDWIVLASNNTTNPRSEAKLIMHKKYRMFMAGDGGIFSGGTYVSGGSANFGGAENEYYRPVWVDAEGRPKVCDGKNPWLPPNGVYNAHFLANLIIWAFEAAVD
jgi:hypothetical protein